jgi:hypothetical protein
LVEVVHVNTLSISARRYTGTPFPPYRFVPGRHPHPTASPRGHSYRAPGEPEPHVTFYPPEAWFKSPDYLYGCDLYNHAFWWEAHEAWEGLWKTTPGASAQRHFLQGVIQVSAAHLQLFQASEQGVSRLRETSRNHLEKSLLLAGRDDIMGLDARAWMAGVESYFRRCVDEAAGVMAHNAQFYPYVVLDV